MADMYYYNGVLMPEIPADVLAEYPYCAIVKYSSKYRMNVSTKPKYVYWNDAAQEYYCRTETCNIGYLTCTNGRHEWDADRHEKEDDFHLCLPEYLVWSNYDIVMGQNGTDVYFKASEPIPPVSVFTHNAYAITRDRLVGIAKQARRLGNVVGELTPAQIEAALSAAPFGSHEAVEIKTTDYISTITAEVM